MERITKIAEPEFSKWDDVNKALREIAECKIGLETLESEMNMAINDAKLKAEKLGKPLKTAIKLLEAKIETYVAMNNEDLEGKSKELNFGTVGYRQSTRISYSSKDTTKIIEQLKKCDMHICIIVKESINKDALKRFPDKTLLKIGVKRKIEDKFYIEVDHERLKG